MIFHPEISLYLEIISYPEIFFLVLEIIVYPRIIAYFKIILGFFGKYHNTLCLSTQKLHKNCVQFLLGLRTVLRENKNNAYATFGGTNKEYYDIFRSGLCISRYLHKW